LKRSSKRSTPNGDDEQSARELLYARYGDAVRLSWGEEAEDLVDRSDLRS
jgi:hypothetical protein